MLASEYVRGLQAMIDNVGDRMLVRSNLGEFGLDFYEVSGITGDTVYGHPVEIMHGDYMRYDDNKRGGTPVEVFVVE